MIDDGRRDHDQDQDQLSDSRDLSRLLQTWAPRPPAEAFLERVGQRAGFVFRSTVVGRSPARWRAGLRRVVGSATTVGVVSAVAVYLIWAGRVLQWLGH